MTDQPGQTPGTTSAPPGPEPGYQPQQPVAYSSGSGPSGPRAGFWIRFAGLLLDGLILAVPTIVLFLIFDVGIAYVLTFVVVLAYFIALEGGPRGVTSNCICPAYVRTPLVENQIADQARIHGISEAEVVEKVMLTEPVIKRLLEPDEVADAVLFLCSDAAAFVNGTSLVLDGGWTAR